MALQQQMLPGLVAALTKTIKQKQKSKMKNYEYSNLQKEGTCKYCGHGNHARSKCPARNSTCNNCGKRGHYAKVCLSKLASNIKAVTHDDTEDSDESDYYVASEVTCNKSRQIYVKCVSVDNVKIQFEVDTGAGVNIIPYSLHKEKLHHKPLFSQDRPLKAVGAAQIVTMGYMNAMLKYNAVKVNAKIYVVKCDTSCLLSRDS